MSNFLLGSYGLRALSADGDPLDGALLYQYAAGTETNQATYSNRGLSSQNANPLEADGDGWFSSVYGTDDVAYKFVLKTSAGVTVQTWDNVYTAQLTDDTDTQVVTSPLDYGAVGDGVTNDRADVQEALDAINTANGGTLNLLAKTYRVDTTISVYSNTRVIGPGTLQFTTNTSDEYISLQGTLGTAYALSANAAYRASSLTASSSGIAQNDMVLIQSSQVVAGSVTSGEVNTIRSISGTTHNLTASLNDAFNTADSATIREITPVENVIFENLDITCSASASGTAATVFFLNRCRNVKFKNVRINGLDTDGFGWEILQSLDVTIDGCEVEAATVGNGVYIGAGSRNTLVKDSFFTNLQWGILTQTTNVETGGPHEIVVVGNTFRYTTLDAIFQPHITGVVYERNHIFMGTGSWFLCSDGVARGNRYHDDGAHQVVLPSLVVNRSSRPWAFSFEDNHFSCEAQLVSTDGSLTGSGGTTREIAILRNVSTLGLSITLTWDGAVAIGADRVIVNGNRGPGDLAVTVSGASASIDRLYVKDNIMDGIAITDGGTGTINHVECDRNVLESNNVTLIDVISTSGIIYVRDNILEGDSTNTTTGINTDGGSLVCVNDNTVRNLVSGAWGILVEDVAASSRVECRGNNVNSGGAGIFLDLDGAPTAVVLSDNTVRATVGSTLAIDATTGATNFVVANNNAHLLQTSSAQNIHCLHVTGFVTGLVISGNHFIRADDDDTNIHLEATASGDITRVHFSGNVLQNGLAGIEATNGDGSYWYSGGDMYSVTDEFTGAIGRRLLFKFGTGTPQGSITTSETLTGTAFTIPANLLAVGDILRTRLYVHAVNSSGSTATMSANVASGSNPLTTQMGVSTLTGDTTFLEDTLDFYIVSSTTSNCSSHSAGATDTTGGVATVTLANFFGQTAPDGSGSSFDIDIAAGVTLSVLAATDQDNAATTFQVMSFTIELLREGT